MNFQLNMQYLNILNMQLFKIINIITFPEKESDIGSK